MADFFAERVAFTTATEGTGSIAVGSRLGPSFRLPDEAGIVNGDNPILLIQDGDDYEIVAATASDDGDTYSRDTVLHSMISGVTGTTKLDLSGAAEVRFLPPAPSQIAQFARRNLANTFTAKQTFQNTVKLQQALEKWNTVADNPASGDNNIDLLTAACWRFTTDTDANFVFNFRGDGSNTLNSIMAVDESITIIIHVKNGATPYYGTGIKIDTSAVTPQWLGAPAPVAGTANKRDSYTFTIKKTADATFEVDATFAGGN